jgi:cardiolipin synthase
MDDVDVRLLVPSATDIPILRPLSRSGYRTLLEAGVRIFEWNGSMLHAKTAVADGRWARVGSTNLNIASWFGNCEMDAVVEDERFGAEMENMYLDDLTNATEVVLDERDRVRAHRRPRQSRFVASGGGSGGRAAAGALRIGNAVGAAFAGKRVLEPVEARLMMIGGTLMLGLAVLFFTFPRALVYPIVVILTWLSIALLYRGTKLFFVKEAPETEETPEDTLQEPAKHEIPQQPVDGRMP